MPWKMVDLSFANEGKASIKELWENIAALSAHVVEDNSRYDGKYPADVRLSQVRSLQVMLDELKLATDAAVRYMDPDFDGDELNTVAISDDGDNEKLRVIRDKAMGRAGGLQNSIGSLIDKKVRGGVPDEY